MSGQLSLFDLESCGPIVSVISLPGLGGGRGRSSLLAGRTTGLSGLGVVRVSRFRGRDSGRVMPTSDTSGPLFSVSSRSARLQWCLASRLRARMGGSGSRLYGLIWRDWDMPAGGPICALRGSGRRISGSGCTGWPTPNAVDGSIPSAISENTLRRGDPDGPLRSTSGSLAKDVVWRLAGWPTPTGEDSSSSGVRDYPATATHHVGTTLTDAARMVSGTTPSGFRAATGSSGQLNPRFSLWLMGYGTAWASCGERVTVSSRRSRRSS